MFPAYLVSLATIVSRLAILTSAQSVVPSSTSQVSLSSTTRINQPTSSANFPPVGSVNRDYSDAGLEKLWDIVGPVQAPPFTTTRLPDLPIPIPSSPPALYPSWFAPAPKDVLPNFQLPKGFKFGVATAAYQVEGAVKNEGKGPSMWDWNSRQPGGVVDNTTADVVDLQYYLYKEDVARVAALGINAHSFSISWARIFPFGTADSPVNQLALDHYSDYSNLSLLNSGTHSMNLAFIAANSVDILSTDASLPSGVNSSTAPYQCSYYVLKAHAGAVKAFREMKIEGEISFKNDDFVGIPWRANNTEDIEAVERHAAFRIGAFSNPTYTTGDWPKIMIDELPPSYLPRFSAADKKDLLGSADFFATDAYRTQWVAAPPDGMASCVHNTSHPMWPECHTVVLFDTNGWAAGPSPDPLSDSWLQATPNFLRASLVELQKRWPTKKMYISEFGFVEPFEAQWTDLFRITEDVTRTNYYMTYLGEILLAIHEDKLPIAGTFAWAMVDNAEWNSGLSARFGIQYVNYTTLERVYKRSALSLSEFYNAHVQK
ncbi:hypothetical protein C0991_002668 [Blastosporella zonata]|nr:hypothetical protein C0991_002668 [Blastosporella zonata]